MSNPKGVSLKNFDCLSYLKLLAKGVESVGD